MDQHKKDKIKARELDERITKIEKFLWSESGYAAGGIPSESPYNVSGAHNEVPEGEDVPVLWSSGEDSRKAREGAEAASDRGAVVDPGAWERLGAAYRAVADAPAPETCVGVRLAAEDQVNAANAEFVREVSRLVASLLLLDEHDVTTTRAVAWIKSWYESVTILREQLRSSKETNTSLMGKLDEAQDRAYEAEQRESALKRGWPNFVAEVTGKNGGMSFDDMTDWIRAKENTVKLADDGRVHQTVAAKGDDRAGEGRASPEGVNWLWMAHALDDYARDHAEDSEQRATANRYAARLRRHVADTSPGQWVGSFAAKPRVRTCGHCGRVNGVDSHD